MKKKTKDKKTTPHRHKWLEDDGCSHCGFQERYCEKSDAWQAKLQRANICTIGFYTGYMWGYETFAQNFNKLPDMKNWSGMTYIPKGCIKKVMRLK